MKAELCPLAGVGGIYGDVTKTDALAQLGFPSSSTTRPRDSGPGGPVCVRVFAPTGYLRFMF